MTNTNRAAIQYECGRLAWFPGTVSVTDSIHSTVGFAVSIGRCGASRGLVTASSISAPRVEARNGSGRQMSSSIDATMNGGGIGCQVAEAESGVQHPRIARDSWRNGSALASACASRCGPWLSRSPGLRGRRRTATHGEPPGRRHRSETCLPLPGIPSLRNSPTTRLALPRLVCFFLAGHLRSAGLTSVTLSDSHQ